MGTAAMAARASAARDPRAEVHTLPTAHTDTAALALAPRAEPVLAEALCFSSPSCDAWAAAAARPVVAAARQDWADDLAADPIRCLCHMPLQLPTLALVAVVVAAHAVGALRSISALGAAAVEAVAAVEVAGVLEQVLVVVEAVCAKPSAAVLLCLRQPSVANAMAVARMVDADLLSLGPVVHVHVEVVADASATNHGGGPAG